jgi:RNA polymerase sigma-70 factor (ECF subfamily)
MDGHAGMIYKVARSHASGHEDRQDLQQDIWVQAWRAFDSWDSSRSFSTWLYRIALNTAFSWLRRRPRGTLPLEEAPEPAAGEAAYRQVREILLSLDDLSRALMILHLEGCTHEEAGEVMGITPASAAARISRLKAKLRGEDQSP